MSLPNQHPPLLLTKRLTSFLHSNQTPHLPTLLVSTQTGKLLAHASSNPVSLLRTHATVAASLFAIHTTTPATLSSTLPGDSFTPEQPNSPDPEEDNGEDHDEEGYEESDREDQTTVTEQSKLDPLRPATITVQLTGGTVLIRRLKCGLLLVCVGPNPSDHPDHHLSTLDNGDNALASATVSTSPSEVASQISVGAQTNASYEGTGTALIGVMRKQVSDLARWLDDKLGTLTVPDGGVRTE